jgi:hypothetical protein
MSRYGNHRALVRGQVVHAFSGRRSAPLLVLPVVLSFGCVPKFEEDLTTIAEPRVLAVRAEPAEVAEGAPVLLTSLVAGEASAEDVSFSFCIARKPLSELGPVDPSCFDRRSDSLIALGAGESVSAVVPEEACSLFGPKRPDPEPGEPAGRPVDPDPTFGFYQPVLAALEGQNDVVLGAVRLSCDLIGASREVVVEYNQRHRLNTNVEVERVALRRGGAWRDIESSGTEPLRVERGAVVQLRVDWARCGVANECGDGECGSEEDEMSCAEDCGERPGCTGAEQVVRFDPETRGLIEERESLIATWYATDGDFDSLRTSPEGDHTKNQWYAPDRAGTHTLWVVVRDGRGGVGFWSGTLEVD